MSAERPGQRPPGPPGRPPVPGPPEPPSAAADAVAGLAREVDGLRRQLEPLTGIPSRVDDLAGLVAQLVESVTALTARRAAAPCPSWLMLPADPATAEQVLEELCVWLASVYLRYADAAAGLPECWCWHPDVVEELLWLMHAWLAAYQGAAASVALVGDWHDRQRPGVVARIRKSAGSCSRENHQTRLGWTTAPSGPPAVPGLDAVAVIAAWWATRRDQPAPEPEQRDSGADLLNTPLARDWYR